MTDEQKKKVTESEGGKLNDKLDDLSKENQEFIDSEIKLNIDGVESKKSSETKSKNPTRKRRRWSPGKIISLVVIVFSLVVVGFGGVIAYSALSAGGEITGEDPWSLVKGVFQNGGDRKKLDGEDEGRTNFLLLGVDKKAHLTDTIIILSYYYDEGKFVTINIPRDFQVYEKGSYYKINAMYTFAEQRNDDSKKIGRAGPEAVSDFLENEFAIDIHYWATIDFDGVKGAVDELGGIEVNVERSFTDCTYPKDDYSGVMRPCPSFEAGPTKMDGKTALIYARSRHGNNGESGDFARSKRQSIVIEALLDKASEEFSLKNMSINKIINYLDLFRSNFVTSMESAEILSFYTYYKEHKEGDMTDFYRITWDTSNPFLCFDLNEYSGSVVTYCDGAIAGISGQSSSREMARNQIKNALQESKYSDLYNASIIVLGNNSDKLRPVFDSLRGSGLNICSTCYNNLYSHIERADGSEVVTVYISSSTIREKFEEVFSEEKLGFEYVLKGEMPAENYLTPNNQGTDVVVWIE